MREHINEDTLQNRCTQHTGTNTDRDTKCASHTVATYIVLFGAVYLYVALAFFSILARTGNNKAYGMAERVDSVGFGKVLSLLPICSIIPSTD